MKKILYLICNAHLDPVWQWDWDEGASAALSTFYAACELLDKYDFVFCHNEVLLYEYIERYDPVLFKRIQKLVEEGKWKIMGGWYVQPDCLVPSGESFIRQCSLGREYFQEKFNSRPTTALNFDSFGHTRGIPEILTKCGYDSYIFCRPMPFHHLTRKEDLPHGPFLWKGYDGSKVKAIRIEDLHIYCSPRGKAKENILRKENNYKDLDIVPILWGIGNHGGGASAKDLEDILELKDEKKGEWEIIHSTLEDYFKSVNPTTVIDEQLICFIKSYSSYNAIKLAHDQLENALYFSEKVCSMADIAGKYSYNKEVFKDAERVLCQIEFHDVLSGTAIKTGTMSSIMKVNRAIDSLKQEMFHAFSNMAADLNKVTPNDDNFVFLNPYPFEFDDYVEAEFFIEDGRGFQEYENYVFTLYDEKGNKLEYQDIKPESYINMDRRKRLLFKLHMEPCSVKSIGVHRELKHIESVDRSINGDVIYKDKCKEIVINSKTGLLDKFMVNGVDYIKQKSFAPIVFNDNEDPWGWNINKLNDEYGVDTQPLHTGKNYFKEMKADNSHQGVFVGIDNIHIVEKGPLCLEVESLFSNKDSHVIINYKIYKDTPYIDVNVRTLWNEAKKGLKLRISTLGKKEFFAQMAFGIEKYKPNEMEYPINRYVGVSSKDNLNNLVIYNKSGIHSASKKGDNLYLTLLNGSLAACHPLGPNTDVVHDRTRYLDYIEQGTHEFKLRIGVNKIEECERNAQIFNSPLYAVSYFPHGDGKGVVSNLIQLSNPNIVVSALKKLNNGTYMIRLYNGSFKSSSTVLTIDNVKVEIKLGKFEFKTFVFDKKKIKESKDSSIY